MYIRITGHSINTEHCDAVDQAINHMIGESTKYPVMSNVEFELEAVNVIYLDNYFSAIVIGKYLKKE